MSISGYDPGIDQKLSQGTEDEDDKGFVHVTGFRLYEAGETIFEEGERGAETFIIKSGNVRITHHGGTLIGTFGPGEIIGELAVISDMERVGTAVAEEETVCVVLTRAAMQFMMRTVDLEMRTIIEFLADYIRDIAEGNQTDHELAKRHRRILEFLINNHDTRTKLALQEPFFQLLCNSLMERAKQD